MHAVPSQHLLLVDTPPALSTSVLASRYTHIATMLNRCYESARFKLKPVSDLVYLPNAGMALPLQEPLEVPQVLIHHPQPTRIVAPPSPSSMSWRLGTTWPARPAR